ncbi:MAG TPA: hypothetical protein VFR02_09500 [bacterium]|nr:hypothetical protein [bacterium]
MRNIFLALALLGLAWPRTALAGFSLELMGGDALNFPSPLSIHQAGYPDLDFTARYDTRPYNAYAPYYAWRASLWDGSQAWELEQVHHKLFLTDPPPQVQAFAIHYGYNYFFVNHAWRYPDLILRLGTGPIITNPSNTVRGQVLVTHGTGWFDQGYDFSGWGAQVSAARDLGLFDTTYLVAELALIGGWAWDVPVANGSADVPTLGLHFHLGLGLDL